MPRNRARALKRGDLYDHLYQSPMFARWHWYQFIFGQWRRGNARAAGVTDVEVDGQTVRCLVYGSFQPFLEAVRGYEVISLTSLPTLDGSEVEPPDNDEGGGTPQTGRNPSSAEEREGGGDG